MAVMVWNVIICPTRPALPIPEPVALHVMPNTTVDTGPSMALAMMAGSQITGLRMILPICSMLVPSPCARRPPILFSRKLATAKPTMLQQQPTTAAPAARPFRSNIMPSAAELIGSVRIMPISTDTIMPIKSGCCSVPQLIREPIHTINAEIGGPRISPTAEPASMPQNGVTRISTFVLPLTRCPASMAI